MLYGMAVQSGTSAAILAVTGENAGTRQAYNVAYSDAARRINAAEARVTAERNISQINQDKILSNTVIQMQQDQAVAAAKVSAATAGVHGQSVEDVMRSTETSEQRQLANIDKVAKGQTDVELAKAFQAQSVALSVQDTQSSTVGALLSAFSGVTDEDVKAGYELYSKYWGNSGETDA